MDTLTLTYTQWKQIRAKINVNTYYNGHDLYLVDLPRHLVYLTHVSGADWTNFVATIQPNATAQPSQDACIAAEILRT